MSSAEVCYEENLLRGLVLSNGLVLFFLIQRMHRMRFNVSQRGNTTFLIQNFTVIVVTRGCILTAATMERREERPGRWSWYRLMWRLRGLMVQFVAVTPSSLNISLICLPTSVILFAQFSAIMVSIIVHMLLYELEEQNRYRLYIITTITCLWILYHVVSRKIKLSGGHFLRDACCWLLRKAGNQKTWNSRLLFSFVDWLMCQFMSPTNVVSTVTHALITHNPCPSMCSLIRHYSLNGIIKTGLTTSAHISFMSGEMLQKCNKYLNVWLKRTNTYIRTTEVFVICP